jgi:hypothetical protein
MSELFHRLRGFLPNDPTEMHIALFMLGGSVLMGLAAWLVARSNARLQRRIDNKRTNRRAEAHAAQQAIDALSGRTGAAACERPRQDLAAQASATPLVGSPESTTRQ